MNKSCFPGPQLPRPHNGNDSTFQPCCGRSQAHACFQWAELGAVITWGGWDIGGGKLGAGEEARLLCLRTDHSWTPPESRAQNNGKPDTWGAHSLQQHADKHCPLMLSPDKSCVTHGASEWVTSSQACPGPPSGFPAPQSRPAFLCKQSHMHQASDGERWEGRREDT